MFDWDRDIDDVIKAPGLPRVAAPSPRRGRIRRALATLGLPAVAAAVLLAAPGFAPASPDAAMSVFGFSRLSMPATPPPGLLSYDQAQYDNFRRGIVAFSDSELLAYAAATRRDQADPRLTLAPWDLDALRLTDLEIARRGLQVQGVATDASPRSTLTPAI